MQFLVRQKYPDTNPTSIIPSDHSGPNPRSGRSYCQCSERPSQIFAHDNGGYKVLVGTRNVSGRETAQTSQSPSDSRVTSVTAPIQNPEKILIIDDAFIGEWEPRYDETEGDEGRYQKLVPIVARDMALLGTISKDTFLAIWSWKGAMRVIGHVAIEAYDGLYAPAFRRMASEPSERKLAALIAPGVKLPGVEAATGSTIIHFVHPRIMPIMDVRTIGVLFIAGLISTERKDLGHYEEFRRAINGIRKRCPRWSLRQIDRALFAYHKQILAKDGVGVGRRIS